MYIVFEDAIHAAVMLVLLRIHMSATDRATATATTAAADTSAIGCCCCSSVQLLNNALC